MGSEYVVVECLEGWLMWCFEVGALVKRGRWEVGG